MADRKSPLPAWIFFQKWSLPSSYTQILCDRNPSELRVAYMSSNTAVTTQDAPQHHVQFWPAAVFRAPDLADGFSGQPPNSPPGRGRSAAVRTNNGGNLSEDEEPEREILPHHTTKAKARRKHNAWWERGDTRARGREEQGRRVSCLLYPRASNEAFDPRVREDYYKLQQSAALLCCCARTAGGGRAQLQGVLSNKAGLEAPRDGRGERPLLGSESAALIQ